MTKTITPRQSEVLELLRTFIDEMGYSPSLGELQRMLGITKRAVVKHLEALERKGFIERSSAARGIQLLEKNTGQLFFDIDILGYANAGTPMVTAEQEQLGYLRVRKSLLPLASNVFALMIKGDSMNERDISGIKLEDGKYALVAKDREIRNGDVVLAIIDNCATIKSYRKNGNMIILYPESSNSRHNPFYLDAREEDAAYIYGKVVAVLDNPQI